MADTLINQQVRGYQILESIGSGGFGEVYHAYQPTIERDVAIKVILSTYANTSDFIRRFETEARLVARLEHPFIVPLYDYWRDPSGAYLVMRWLRGGSLSERLRQAQLDSKTILQIMEQITAALIVAHRNNVVHRDVKPANVLFDEDENAYLTDFGFAKDLSQHLTTEEEAIVGSPGYMAPEQIDGTGVTPLSDIYSLGVLLYELTTRQHPFPDASFIDLITRYSRQSIPLIDHAALGYPAGINEIIQRATAQVPGNRYPNALAFMAALRDAFASRPTGLKLVDSDSTQPVVVVNPYKGLRPFEQTDSPDFFGREQLIERLLERLQENTPDARFLALVGPSGSGKSSTVRAGLLAALRRGKLPHSESWFIEETTPGPAPLKALEAVLLSVAVGRADGLLEMIQSSEDGLHRAVQTVLPPAQEFVLYIDQFEEAFTLLENEEERVRYLDLIRAAVMAPHSQLRVVISLRADFTDRPLQYAGFAELLRQRTEFVLPMTQDDIRRAILGPAQRVGLEVEPELVTAIISDVREQPGTLPLLQYAMMEVFSRRHWRTLSLQAYRESGGVLGALARRADELYTSLTEPQQAIVRQIMLRLITLGEGSEDTRRRVRWSELLSSIQDKTNFQTVLDTFGKYRLLTFDRDPISREPTVEIAHEALIREWGRLREWLNTSRTEVRFQRLLSLAAAEWEHAQRDASFLLQGTRLAQFEEWATATNLALTQQEHVYLESSIAERKRRLAEEQQRLERETRLEHRSRRALQMLVAVLAVAAVIAVGLMLFAFNQSQIAQQERDNAQAARQASELNARLSRENALLSDAQLSLHRDDNAQLAIMLALEANKIRAQPNHIQQILAETAYAPGTRRVYTGHKNTVNYAVFSADGQRFISVDRDMIMLLWETGSGNIIQKFNPDDPTTKDVIEGHSANIWTVALSPDGKQVLSGGVDTIMLLWDVDTGKVIRPLKGHTKLINQIVFSRDGKRALSASEDMSVILWDVATGQIIHRFGADNPDTKDVIEGHSQSVYSAIFSRDERQIFTSSDDRSIIQWDIETFKPIKIMTGHTNRVNSLALTPDGKRLLSASFDQTVRLWDIESGKEIRRMLGHTANIYRVDISPDGATAVSSSQDTTIRLWNLETGLETRRYRGHTDRVVTAFYSPDGQSILSASQDFTVRLWDVNALEELMQIEKYPGAAYDVDYSPDGKLIVSGSVNGVVRLSNAQTGQTLRQFPLDDPQTKDAIEGHGSGRVLAAAFLPDGKRLVSASEDKSIILWNAETGELLRRFGPQSSEKLINGHSDAVWSLAVSPDGKRIASGSFDKSVLLWNVETGQVIRKLIRHTDVVMGLAFSPDGETLLSASWDRTIVLWDVASGREIRTLRGHTDWIWAVAFSPDGKTALSASADKTAILWDIESGNVIRRFSGHTDSVLSVAFSPDGKLAVSGGRDNRVMLWDVATGDNVRQYVGHSSWVWDVIFSLDGKAILSSGNDSTARLWPVQTLDELVRWTLANRYIGQFTCLERKQFHIQPPC